MRAAFALLVGIVIATSALHAQGPAAVSGVVRDEAGSPIREALVVIDPDSLSLRLRITEGCIYLNGQPRTELALQDIDPNDVEALAVYVPGTLEDRERPCERGAIGLPPS